MLIARFPQLAFARRPGRLSMCRSHRSTAFALGLASLASIVATGCGSSGKAKDAEASDSVSGDGVVGNAICGNGKCEAGETSAICPSDCKAATAVCGNGHCEAGETSTTCAADCKGGSVVCGNGKCEAGETSTTCPADCKTTGAVCGNGTCEVGESATTCPADCKTTGAMCGNGNCESGESSGTCPADCPTSGDVCQFTMPTIDPGCTSSADQASLATLTPGSDAAALFGQVVLNCTLGGCLTKGGSCPTNDGKDVAEGLCIAGCIRSTSTLPVSPNCAWCFGEFTGVCGFKFCENECSVIASSSACQTCLATHCGAQTTACMGTSSGQVCGNGTCDVGETSATCPSDCPGNGGNGCSAIPSSAGGCGGCSCQACVCNGPIPNGEQQGDAFCCSGGWDELCASECKACGSCQ
jgi:hypothetical protein